MKNKKQIITVGAVAATIAMLGGVSAFLTFKTTLTATAVACILENEPIGDYLKFGMMPDGMTYSSYKKSIVYAIRVKKAEEIRLAQEQERKQTAAAVAYSLADQMYAAYTCVPALDTEENTRQLYEAYVEKAAFPVRTDTEKDAIKELIGGIADSAHYLMSSDAYYVGRSEEDVRALREKIDNLSDTAHQDNETLVQVSPGEYDPKPDKATLEKYAKDMDAALASAALPESSYDYLYLLERKYTGSEAEMLVAALVGASDCLILEASVKMPASCQGALADGTARPFADGESCIEFEKPLVGNVVTMQESADQFMECIYAALSSVNSEEELDEAYQYFYAEKGADNSQEEYDRLALIKRLHDLNGQIDEKYPVRDYWGANITLRSFVQCMRMFASYIVDHRYIAENYDTYFGEEPDGSQAVAKYLEEDEKLAELKEFCFSVQSAALLESKMIQPAASGADGPYAATEELGGKPFEQIAAEFKEGWEAWSYERDEAPEAYCAGYFKYSFDRRDSVAYGTAELIVLMTANGYWITDFAVDWDESLEGFLADNSRNFYKTPNYYRIEEEAKAAVDRNAYASDEEYERAIATWERTNYPDYFDSPNSQQNVQSASYITSAAEEVMWLLDQPSWYLKQLATEAIWGSYTGEYYFNKSVYGGIKGTLRTMWEVATDVTDRINEVGEEFMSGVSDRLGEAAEDVVSGAADFAGSLWNTVQDWW